MKKLLAIFTMLFVFGVCLPTPAEAQKRYRKSYSGKRYESNKRYNSNRRYDRRSRNYDRRCRDGRRDRRSVYRRHRNLINIGIGTGAGAIVGGIIGGKKGALIGAGVGAGAGAAYTYGINPKKKRRYRNDRRYRRP